MRAATWSVAAGLMLLLAGGAPAAALASDEASAAWWVFFRDRGPQAGAPAGPGEGISGARLLDLARAIPREAWARRARTGRSPLPEARDLPLWEPYVREVSACGRLRQRSRWFNAVSVELCPAAREAVAALPFVREMRPVARARSQWVGPEYDEQGRPLEDVFDTRAYSRPAPAPGRTPYDILASRAGDNRELLYGASFWQLDEIEVPPVHDLGYSGNRIRLMMLDTGFRKNHEAFAHSDILAERDYVFDDGETQNEPEDHPNAHSHGTATWGALGAFAPGHLIGPAYGATFALAKTEDIRSETQVEEDYYVAALEWADSLGVVVTSASLAYECFDDGFCYEFEDKDGDTAVITRALDIAAARGIACVNCMGNYGCETGSLGTPADADSMISVGAVDSLNAIAGWSACGPTYDGRTKPEVLARGVRTLCVDDDEVNTYGYASGTSLSTPLVGGAVALLLEAHPEWGPLDVRAALMETADRAWMPDNRYGWGRIRVAQALQRTPVIFPLPFSLVSPADSARVPTVVPTFVWRATMDPNPGSPLLYTLWLDDLDDPGNPACVPAGSDTMLTLPFPLTPDRTYRWEVTVEDPAGHRRTSRETHTIFSPSIEGVDDPPPATASRGLRLRCAPNPCAGPLRLRCELPESTAGIGASGAPAEADCSWALYDPLGRRVAAGSAPWGDGFAEDNWDGNAADGRPAGPGVYYLEVRAGWRFARETVLRVAR